MRVGPDLYQTGSWVLYGGRVSNRGPGQRRWRMGSSAGTWRIWAVVAGALLATAVQDGTDGNTYATAVDATFGLAAAARCVLLWRRHGRARP